jgi:hypothetical protein
MKAPFAKKSTLLTLPSGSVALAPIEIDAGAEYDVPFEGLSIVAVGAALPLPVDEYASTSVIRLH